jgi:hypothetical protein
MKGRARIQAARVPAMTIVLCLIARRLIGPEYLVGDHQTGKQYKARNHTADDASGVLERFGRVCVHVEHGHLL